MRERIASLFFQIDDEDDDDMCVCMCVCVCVCVWEREREREREYVCEQLIFFFNLRSITIPFCLHKSGRVERIFSNLTWVKDDNDKNKNNKKKNLGGR